MEQFQDGRSSVDCHILYLKQQACQFEANQLQRKLYLTKLIRCIENSGRLWKEASPYYEDALQMTWVYCCLNLCESGTGKAYDAERASVVTWLNSYLKWRLHDLSLAHRQRSSHVELSELADSSSLWDSSKYRPEIPPILEETKSWVEQDEQHELRSLSLKDHPQVTAQFLILQRLPPEKSWQDLSDELKISISTLSSFYRRHCLPALRKFGKNQGYL